MSTAPPLRREELAEAFSAFTFTARGLEEAYRALQERAEALDMALHEANQRLAAILSALPLGVVAADGEGRIRATNEAAGRLLGVGRDRLEGRQAGELADAGGAPLLLPTGAPEDRELPGSRLRVRHVPMPGEGGALWLLEDRTELERLEGQVANLDRLAALGRMALSIAHEIRNPLNGVAGFAGLLRQRLREERERRYAELIEAGVGRIDAIIRNLLAFARPGSLALKPLDLAATVNRILEEWRGGRVEAELPPEPAPVRGDATALRQVLENLLTNAVEAGGAAVPIAVTLEGRGGSWILAVEDGGPGIPPEMREAVFEPFRSGKEKGTGLGLAIVQRIVELHGGRVRAVAPRRLPGARLEVVLPGGGGS